MFFLAPRPPNIPVKARPSAAGTSRKRAAPYLKR